MIMKKIAKIIALVAAVLMIAIGCKKLPEFTQGNSGGGGSTTGGTLYYRLNDDPEITSSSISISAKYGSDGEITGMWLLVSEKADMPAGSTHYADIQMNYPEFSVTLTGLNPGTNYFWCINYLENENSYVTDPVGFTTLESGGGTTWYSPDPDNGTIPTSVLPEELLGSVTTHFTVYSGDNPPTIQGQFVSKPHMLFYSTIYYDTAILCNDRCFAFFQNEQYVDFYGKQWDDNANSYYEEVYRNLYIIGEGDCFTCYYLTEGYPDGLYAKQSTIFSGIWNESYGGVQNFKVAVILLETSGNPNLEPVNSFRVLGDGDGLAQDTAWLGKVFATDSISISDEDAFMMFKKH